MDGRYNVVNDEVGEVVRRKEAKVHDFTFGLLKSDCKIGRHDHDTKGSLQYKDISLFEWVQPTFRNIKPSISGLFYSNSGLQTKSRQLS